MHTHTHARMHTCMHAHMHACTYTRMHTQTHTHTQPFYSSLDFVQDNPGEPVPEKNILPLKPIVVIGHPLSASSIYCDPCHPPCSIYMPDSLSPQSYSCWLGLFKPLAHSFCFFRFAKEITLFVFWLLFLYSFQASDFSFFPISIFFLLFPYCCSNFLIPPPCFLMPAWAFWQSTCHLCSFHHYIFHLLPVFIYAKVFPLYFR